MLRVLIITVTLSCAFAQDYHQLRSAASEAQRRFAIQNRYDDTGPGAKGPEYAYNTYRTLEEALVSYIHDNDTKLPDHERAKVERFVSTDFSQPIRELPKTVEEYTGLKRPTNNQILRPAPLRRPQPITSFYQSTYPQPIIQQPIYQQPIVQQPIYQQSIYQQPINQPIVIPPIIKFKPEKLFYQDPSTKYSFLDFRSSDLRQSLQGERLDFRPKIQPVRSSPLSLAHYTRSDVDEQYDQHHDHHPQYTFSYGVHDKKTGDSKSAHETRDGGSVKGYYTFMDADGKQRTVHYTADDKLGFRATVQRTQMNSQ